MTHDIYLKEILSNVECAALSASNKTSEADLTDNERFALAFYAGCPFVSEMEEMKLVFRIKGLVGFAKVDGKWQVFHRETEGRDV